ncbi:MAG: sugar phosphate isomerase/epimerase [Planctomycetes bacterium]|nr:sugar phosphate isomerase/epimerase [Planctomycetota bacterium]
MATQRPSQLAVTLFTLRDFCNSPEDIVRTLARVRKIGYRNIQISGGGLMAVHPPDLARMAADAGLRIIGSHIALQMFRDGLKNIIWRLHQWNCPYVAIPWMAPEDRATLADWKARAKEFSALGRTLAKEGMALQYHNHHFEFHKFGGRAGLGGKTGLEVLYERSDPKRLQAEIDVAWVARGGADPAAWCLRMKGRMHQVHLKDWVMLANEPAWAEVGEGNLNWPAILRACKAAGVRTYIVEQDACPVTNDPFKSIEISLKNLRRMGLK